MVKGKDRNMPFKRNALSVLVYELGKTTLGFSGFASPVDLLYRKGRQMNCPSKRAIGFCAA